MATQRVRKVHQRPSPEASVKLSIEESGDEPPQETGFLASAISANLDEVPVVISPSYTQHREMAVLVLAYAVCIVSSAATVVAYRQSIRDTRSHLRSGPIPATHDETLRYPIQELGDDN